MRLCVREREYSLFYRALLQKRPIVLWSLLIGATSYESVHDSVLQCVLQCVAVCCSVLQ